MSKIFDGLCFCITGTLSKPRKEIEKLIHTHGGDTADTVTLRVVYLITDASDLGSFSAKSEKARSRGVPILSEEFLHNCIKAKRVVDIKPYRFDSADAGKGKGKHAASSSSSTSSSSSSSSSSKVKKVKKVAAPKKKKAKAPEIDAQWSWRTDSGAWEPYDEKVNAKIEALHNKKPPKSGIKTAKIDAERGVDLSRMVQYRLDDPSRIRQLKREENEESSDDSDDDSEPDEKAMLAKLRTGLPKKYMRMAAVPILGGHSRCQGKDDSRPIRRIAVWRGTLPPSR
eukprot:TRINITY_DN12692_c0_g1_i4.p1 TRINITY_DN12692_c0_g1~~TRINITY_DN12692_c0_g1_i4.p1  ORF type:complete len:296 (-),score=67.65 TRINITY_DN12692_c0_g1_i4:709-1560(-)